VMIAVDLDAELVGQKIPEPEVVIAGDICQLDARFDKLRQPEKHREMILGHRVLVLEPEIEQVAEDIQMLPVAGDKIEETVEPAKFPGFGIGIIMPEMNIGNKKDRHSRKSNQSRRKWKGRKGEMFHCTRGGHGSGRPGSLPALSFANCDPDTTKSTEAQLLQYIFNPNDHGL